MRPRKLTGKRRNADDFGVINRTDFEKILINARHGKGSGNENGYVREPQNAIRDTALLAFEYITGKRISELTGRKYFKDLYLGLTFPDNVRLTTIGEFQVLQYKVRILKRGRRKKKCLRCEQKNASTSAFCRGCGASLANSELIKPTKEVWKWKNISLDDPFSKYVLEWIHYLQKTNYEGRLFPLTRVRAWQIMKNLGINNHVNRHWRSTHLSTTMDAFELKEYLDRATIPSEYVHSEPTKQLKKTKEANKIWKE